MSNTPPPLPVKDDVQDQNRMKEVNSLIPINLGPETVSEGEKPALPLRKTTPIYTYNIDDSVSLISIVRQLELYLTPIMFESSEWFSNSSLSIDNLRDKISSIQLEELNDKDKYWYKIVNGDILPIEDKSVDSLEEHIIKGIPDDLRSLVYFKIMQVKSSFHHEDSFEQLLKKARQSLIQDSFIESLSISNNLQDVLRVFNYYILEILSANSIKLDNLSNSNLESDISDDKNDVHTSEFVNVNHFIGNICKVLGQACNISSEDLFFILLKFNKLFHNLDKSEFFYKINRSLEDLQLEVFIHITKQGINLNQFYKKVVYNFFNNFVNSSTVLLKVLDFFVFEGFDFILRLIIWGFDKNKLNILQKNNNELVEFIYSIEFFNDLSYNFEEILRLNPEIIKYENEFHLIYANSLTNNNHELCNLREINEELNLKINQLNHDLSNLEITFNEITQQSDEYNHQLTEATTKNNQLLTIRDQLKQRYEQLSMKENLTNTIKANKEFANRNQELIAQIDSLKASIAEKSAKIPMPSKT